MNNFKIANILLRRKNSLHSKTFKYFTRISVFAFLILWSSTTSAQETWYSYQSGEWGDFTSWTLDGATAPTFVNPSSETPGVGDIVIIRNSHSILMQTDVGAALNSITVNSVTIRSGSRLDLESTTGHDFTLVRGGGTMAMAGQFVENGTDDYYLENLPAGDFTSFADELLGGSIEINTSTNDVPIVLNGSLTSSETVTIGGITETAICRRLVINMDDLDDRVVLQRDLALTGNLSVTQGNFQIHSDNVEPFESGSAPLTVTNTNLNLNIAGDVIISTNGQITTGTANNRHQFNLDGDFTNDGTQTSSFTQLTAQTNTAQTDGLVDLNFLNGTENQELVCNGPTNLYRIEIDKVTASVELSISATETAGETNFRLFGPINNSINSNLQSGGTNNNALALLAGAVRLRDNVLLSSLGSGAIASIGDQASLIIDGGLVGFTGSNALVLYGTIEVASGEFFATGTSGITTRDAGTFNISGGRAYFSQFRTSTAGASAVGGYVQTGGEVTIGSFSESRDGSFRDTGSETVIYTSSTPYDGFYTLSLTYSNNVFIMADGILNVNRPRDAQEGSIFINSDDGNINVTGGTVNITSTGNGQAKITSNAPFYNLNILNTSTGTTTDDRVVVGTGTSGTGGGSRTITTPDLIVLNDLTIETGTTRTNAGNTYGGYLDMCPSGTCANLEVGRNLTIEDSAVLDVFNNAVDNAASSTLTFNGTNDGIFYVGDITSYDESLTEYDDPDGSGAYDNYRLPLFDLVIDKSGGTLQLAAKDPGVEDGAGTLTAGGGKNLDANSARLLYIRDGLSVESGSTLSQIDPTGVQYGYIVRVYASTINVDGNLLVYEQGVNPVNSFLEVREQDQPTVGDVIFINSTDGSTIGNLVVDLGNDELQLGGDLMVTRMAYRHGGVNLGTYNLKVDVMDYNTESGGDNYRLRGGNGEYLFGDNTTGAEQYFFTAGNASDGGLSIKVPRVTNIHGVDDEQNVGFDPSYDNVNNEYQNNNLLYFPIGIKDKYTPAVCYIVDAGTNSYDDDEYITVTPVDSELQTTSQDVVSNDGILDYYWNVDYEGFDIGGEPTVSWLFQYDDSDAGVIGTENETTYIPGKVLDGGAYTRSDDGDEDAVKDSGDSGSSGANEAGNIMGTNPGNIIIFNGITADGDTNDDIDAGTADNVFIDAGAPDLSANPVDNNWTNAFPGTGFPLENADYTAGVEDRFVGAPTVYYSRRHQIGGGGLTWTDLNDWSTDAVLQHGGAAATSFPGVGDVVVIGAGQINGSDEANDTGLTSTTARHQMVSQGSRTVSEIVFNSNPAGTTIGNNLSRIRLTSPTNVLTAGNYSGLGEIMLAISTSAEATVVGDLGGFNNTPNSTFFLDLTEAGTATFSSVTEFPGIRIYGRNSAGRTIRFGNDITGQEILVDGMATLEVGNDITISGDVQLGNNREGYLVFPDDGSNHTFAIGGDLTTNEPNTSTDNQISVAGTGSDVHTLQVGGNIDLQFGDLFDLSTSGSNVILELTGTGTNTFTNSSAASIDLYQIVMNKGSDTTDTFTFTDNFTITDPGTTGLQPVEIINGLLILDNSSIDVTLSDATGDFLLPNTANVSASSGSGGLEVQAGTIRIEGDDTGMLLDGPLILSGGDAIFNDAGSNGNNFIEYSASSNASISITDAGSTLEVGSQIRRSTLSTSGVLDLTITAGLLEIGGGTNGVTSRAMLEILNTGSSFTHTGGTLRFYRQNGTTGNDATVASLYLEPETSDISGTSLIEIDLQNGDPRFSINSTVALNDVNMLSGDVPASGEVVQLRTRSLTINGDLTVSDDITFQTNDLDLTLNGNLTFNDDGSYDPGINTTYFSSADASVIDANSSAALGFYNFTKNGAGETDLTSGNISISGATFELLDGILDDNDNLIQFSGQVMTNNATHTSLTGGANKGVVFNGSDQQILETDSEGVFGNITIQNANGVSLPDYNQIFDIDSTLTLNTGILDIGPALLNINENGRVVNASGNGDSFDDFNETTQIQTNSSIIDFGVQKFFEADSETDFIFPVGEATRYTPVMIDYTNPEATGGVTNGTAGTAGGSIRVRPRNSVAPIMLSENQATQDAVLQYHWLVNEFFGSDFVADIVSQYDDETIGTGDISLYRGARAIFNDPNLAVENPFPTDATDLVDETVSVRTITFPIDSEDDFAGEYFAGDPNDIPDEFSALIFTGNTDNSVQTLTNYIIDENNNGIVDGGETTNPSDFNSEVVGGAIRLADGVNMDIDASNVIFSRLILPTTSSVTVDYANGASNIQLGLVSGSGTLIIESDDNNAALPPGDFDQFFTTCGSGGGALQYGGTGSYPILSETNRVRQLTLTGSGAKTFPSNLITICEDLIINGGTVNLADGTVSTPIEIAILDDLLVQGGTLNFGEYSVLDVSDDANFSGGTTTGTTGSVVEVAGDLIQSGAAVLNFTGSNRATFRMDGTSAQSISGNFDGVNSIGNLTINNSGSGVTISNGISNRVRINNLLTLTDGVVYSDIPAIVDPIVPAELIIIGSNATVSGGSTASHVDGAIRKESIPASSGNFTFPIGDNGYYAPARVSNPSALTNWTALYRNQTPPIRDQIETGADITISTNDLWVVDGASDGVTAFVSATYGVQSDVIDPTSIILASLKDLDDDGLFDEVDEEWKSVDANNAGNSPSAGTVSSTNPLTFSTTIFTLAAQDAAALPVELILFSGVAKENKVLLTWSTASEINNDFFEVQRSSDGLTFEPIGVVQGNGNTNEAIEYSFIDKKPYLGLGYYRLRQVDFDGAEELLPAIQVENNFRQNGIQVSTYPNPAFADNISLRISTGDNHSPISVKLIDMAGKPYFQKRFEGALVIDEKIENLSAMKSGIYFLLVEQGRNVQKQKVYIKK